MDLNPVHIEKAAKEGMKRKGEPAMDEVDEADTLAVTWDWNGVLPRGARLHLLQQRKEALLAQIIELLRLDGGFPPVAVHLLQASLLVHGLARPALALARSFLDYGGESRAWVVLQWSAHARKKMKEKAVRGSEWKVTVKRKKG